MRVEDHANFSSPKETENPPRSRIIHSKDEQVFQSSKSKKYANLWNSPANLNSDSIERIRESTVVESTYTIYSLLEQYQDLGILRHVSTERLEIL